MECALAAGRDLAERGECGRERLSSIYGLPHEHRCDHLKLHCLGARPSRGRLWKGM